MNQEQKASILKRINQNKTQNISNLMKYLIIALLVTGCSSTKLAHKSKTQKYIDKKIESTHRQYAFVNNQIIIFENTNQFEDINYDTNDQSKASSIED
jgi:hypothetical protein